MNFINTKTRTLNHTPLQYSQSERTVRLSLLIWEAAHANVFIVMTSGVFLTGIALLFGANDFELGLLTAIPFALQCVQLLSPYIFKDHEKIRIHIANAFVASRLLWLLVIPLLYLRNIWSLYLLIGVVSLSSILTMVSSPAWLSWMSDIVPKRIRGRFFSRRNIAVASATIVSTIVGSLILDWSRSYNNESMGYTAILLVAVVGGLYSWKAMNRMSDSRSRLNITNSYKIDLFSPLKDRNFLKILIVFALWNFAIGLSAAFYAPHMLLNLKLSFFQIGLYSCTTALVAITSSKLWGNLIDRFGSKPILNLCAFGISLVPLVWLFPRENSAWILIPETIFSGFLWSGFNLAAFTLPIDRSPQTSRTVYLSVFATVTGIAFFSASIIAGYIAEYYSDWSQTIYSLFFINYHILFIGSSLMRFLTAIFISLFHEPSEKKLPIVIQHMGYAVLKRLSIGRQVFPELDDAYLDAKKNKNNKLYMKNF